MAIIPHNGVGLLLYSDLPYEIGGSLWVVTRHFGDYSGGTLEFYRVGRDSSLGVLVWNYEMA